MNSFQKLLSFGANKIHFTEEEPKKYCTATALRTCNQQRKKLVFQIFQKFQKLTHDHSLL